MVQKYSIFAAIQANDVMRNAYLINLVRVLCGLPVSGDSTASLASQPTSANVCINFLAAEGAPSRAYCTVVTTPQFSLLS